MSFDPSTNAANLAALQARCDYQQFVVSVSTTQLLQSQHPNQAQFIVTTQGPNVAISFTAVYHKVKFTQVPLICATSQQAAGTAAVLNDAQNILNLFDLRADFDGATPFLLITPPPPMSAWLPTSRAGLLAWWRSDLGITLNSGNVAMWADQSGNGHNLSQATGSVQPAYNSSGGPGGRPSITYGGAQTLITFTAICAGTSPRSVFIQMSNSASPSTSSFDILRFGLSNPALTIRYDNYTGLGDLTSSDGSFNNTGTYTADSAPHLITLTHTAGTVDPYYVDGVSVSSGPNVSTNDTATAGFQVSPSATFQGQVNEIFIYSDIVSPTDMATALAYQHAFWGF